MKRWMILAAAVLALAPGSARAEGLQYLGWGPRLGATMNPDQFHFGAHADFGQVGSHARLQPNLELGLGDGLTLLSMNLNAAYRLGSHWESWSPYIGAGAGYEVFGSEDTGLRDVSKSGVGLNVLGGFERGMASGSRFFLEGKVGFIEAPDFKVTAGWTFGP